MKRMFEGVTAVVGTLVINASSAFANAPKGEGAPDYSGISSMYYALIGIVLAYGVYDTFFKKN